MDQKKIILVFSSKGAQKLLQLWFNLVMNHLSLSSHQETKGISKGIPMGSREIHSIIAQLQKMGSPLSSVRRCGYQLVFETGEKSADSQLLALLMFGHLAHPGHVWRVKKFDNGSTVTYFFDNPHDLPKSKTEKKFEF